MTRAPLSTITEAYGDTTRTLTPLEWVVSACMKRGATLLKLDSDSLHVEVNGCRFVVRVEGE